MQFVSTRGGMDPVSFCDALLMGLAPDGGLTVPEALPRIDAAQLEAWRPLTYPELAAQVIGLFATDVPGEDLAALTAAAYGPERFPSPVVPLRSLEALHPGLLVAGLSEGPTMAFKDLAMQFLGQAVPYVLARRGQVLTILGATSGDTGSAAEEAFRSQQGVSVVMLSPAGRMSEVQRAQMYSITDDNIHNVAVRGVFDDCQNLVKTLMGDADFKTAHHLGAVNSINIGRIAAQAVYYVWTWLRVTDAAPEDVRTGLQVDVAVPSGNFGNIYAAFLARSMGVPLRRLVLATNENNVLDEFFSTGVYRPRGGTETLATSSPSMDISKASNLERFVAQVLGEEFMRYWTRLESDGVLDLGDRITSLRQEHGFISGTSTHADRLEAIRQVHAATGELIDPHTADGVTVALRVLKADAAAPGADNAPGGDAPDQGGLDQGSSAHGRRVPMVVMETAKAAKFGHTVTEALGEELPVAEVVRELLARPQHVVEIPATQEELRPLVASYAQY